jgi:hypothetical protein
MIKGQLQHCNSMAYVQSRYQNEWHWDRDLNPTIRINLLKIGCLPISERSAVAGDFSQAICANNRETDFLNECKSSGPGLDGADVPDHAVVLVSSLIPNLAPTHHGT